MAASKMVTRVQLGLYFKVGMNENGTDKMKTAKFTVNPNATLEQMATLSDLIGAILVAPADDIRRYEEASIGVSI